MNQLTKRFLKDESAQDMIEYALVTTVIALACIAAIGGVANPIVKGFNTIVNNFNNDY
jgi:Flp pilus assembly pilin Flp